MNEKLGDGVFSPEPGQTTCPPGAVVSARPSVTVYLPVGVDNYPTDGFSLEL